MASFLQDLLSSMGSCLSCFPSSPMLKINNRSFKILRLLGEGGFSYVYLVSDAATSELLALKKIRCPFGAESVAQAMREVESYKLFAHSPHIIHMVDHSIATERGADPATKTVYVLLPYYRRGNLQDLINANLVNHTRFPERRLMLLFLGVCRGLKDMHQYRPGGGGRTGNERMSMQTSKGSQKNPDAGADEDHEADQQRPLMADEHGHGGEVRSYAHRDVKPGNIMISDTGTDPIIMDLGSVAASPLAITSRSLAIATQDTAAEHSTMPYRAPELFDVKTDTVIDTAVDIWSLGCTLYACLVGKSPFEARSDETGGSLSICVLSGDWRFPDEEPGGGGKRLAKKKGKAPAGAEEGEAASDEDDGAISEPVRNVVRRCLRVEPSERPDVDQLIEMIERVLEDLPEDESA